MSDENDDEDNEKPKLKGLETYVHPEYHEPEDPVNESESTLDFQQAKEAKADKDHKPVLKSKFDFMDGEDFMLMKIEIRNGQTEVHFHCVERITHPFNSEIKVWYEGCLGRKEVTLRWWDMFFGVKTLEQKIEKIAGAWMKELKDAMRLEKEIEEINKKFSRNMN